MPEETAPAATPTASGRPSSAPGAPGYGCAALVASAIIVVVLLVSRSWGSTDFPRVAPKEMATRAFQRSQEAYDIMGFKRTVKPGVEKIGVSTENTFNSGFCYDGGMLGLEDKTVDGAYQLSHTWALDHVPASQAASGLRHLRRHLKDNGWKVTSFREGGQSQDWDLFVQRDDGAERMSFTWYPDREYLTAGATAPCAYDPAWKSGDSGPAGDRETPPVLRPTQRD